MFFLIVLSVGHCAPAVSQDLVSPTFDFIFGQHDHFHSHFYVYRDRDGGDQHFFPSGWMGDLKRVNANVAKSIIDDDHATNPYSGRTCIQLHYPRNLRGPLGWIGIYGEFPDRNWKQTPARTPVYDLSKYVRRGETVRVTFFARGEKGGEKAEFKIGGKKGDSIKTSIGLRRQRGLSIRPISLTKKWRKYSIDITGLDLSKVASGFCWATNRKQNPNGCTIYLDEIRFEFGRRETMARLAEPRFVRSYVTEHNVPTDMYFRNACFSYDNALVVLACCARAKQKDLHHAELIGDAFVKVQENDPFGDGRIRNSYSCGDISDPYLKGRPRMPGWWDDANNKWFQDHPYFVSTDSGNMAWVALALISYWETSGRQGIYLERAEKLCDWIYANAHHPDDPIGYTGGVDVVAKTPAHPSGDKKLTKIQI